MDNHPKMMANGLNHRTTFLTLASPQRTFLLFYFFAFLCIIGLAKFDQIWTNEYDFIAKALSIFGWAFFEFNCLAQVFAPLHIFDVGFETYLGWLFEVSLFQLKCGRWLAVQLEVIILVRSMRSGRSSSIPM